MYRPRHRQKQTASPKTKARESVGNTEVISVAIKMRLEAELRKQRRQQARAVNMRRSIQRITGTG